VDGLATEQVAHVRTERHDTERDDDVHRRAAAAADQALRLCLHSHRLVTRARRARVRSERVRAGAAAVRLRSAGGRVLDSFEVEGYVDDDRSTATWRNGRLYCTPELRRRAEVIVSMGDCFSGEAGGLIVQASIVGPPVAAMLTTMRAFSRIVAIDMRWRREVQRT
jgi:hypothetical protein